MDAVVFCFYLSQKTLFVLELLFDSSYLHCSKGRCALTYSFMQNMNVLGTLKIPTEFALSNSDFRQDSTAKEAIVK